MAGVRTPGRGGGGEGGPGPGALTTDVQGVVDTATAACRALRHNTDSRRLYTDGHTRNETAPAKRRYGRSRQAEANDTLWLKQYSQLQTRSMSKQGERAGDKKKRKRRRILT